MTRYTYGRDVFPPTECAEVGAQLRKKTTMTLTRGKTRNLQHSALYAHNKNFHCENHSLICSLYVRLTVRLLFYLYTHLPIRSFIHLFIHLYSLIIIRSVIVLVPHGWVDFIMVVDCCGTQGQRGGQVHIFIYICTYIISRPPCLHNLPWEGPPTATLKLFMGASDQRRHHEHHSSILLYISTVMWQGEIQVSLKNLPQTPIPLFSLPRLWHSRKIIYLYIFSFFIFFFWFFPGTVDFSTVLYFWSQNLLYFNSR